jgi:transketolase
MTEPTQTISQRDAYGAALLEIAQKDKRIVAVTIDLAESTRLFSFREKFPDRFLDVGVSEQAAVGVASGLALVGFIPFLSSFGVFIPGRAFDHIRVSIAMNRANVRLVGSHLGMSNHGDGSTAQAVEDIALIRSLPNMTILSPVDSLEVKKAIRALVDFEGPAYLRISRAAGPNLTDDTSPFKIGQAQVLKEGSDLSLVGCGPILSQALSAARVLEKEGISVEVVNMATIKPLDQELLLHSVSKTRKVLTVEEHSIFGGLGEGVAHVLSQNDPVPIKIMGIKDRFGESARRLEDLYREFGLDEEAIKNEIRTMLSGKNS